MSSKIKQIPFRVIVYIFLMLTLATGVSSCDEATPEVAYFNTGTPVKVLVVMVKWDKEPNCPTAESCSVFSPTDIANLHPHRHNTASEYLTILNNGVNTYYQRATYGQMFFDFELLPGSPNADGWWSSPYSLEQVSAGKMDFKQVAVDVAYSVLGGNLANYERILFISNFQERGGQTCCLSNPTPYYPIPGWWNTPAGGISMIIAQINEGINDQEMITLATHELSHSIGAPDQYYDSGVGLGPWDIMDNDWDFFHFSAWTKLDRGWIDWSGNTTRMPCNSGICEITTTLNPVEIQGNNALLIPIFDTVEFEGIMVECRKPINGDEGIPEDGVLVTFSNPYNLKYLAKTISEIRSNKANKYSLLQPGEVYTDIRNKVQVINQSKPGDANCTVKATRNVTPSPDLYITQGSIVESKPFDRYKSPDIWNDIGANGYAQYPSYETLSKVNTTNDGSIDVPAGYGDPIVVWESQYGGFSNLINYVVHNGGTAVATDVKVNVYVRQPLAGTVTPDYCNPTPNDLPFNSFPKLLSTEIIPMLKPGEAVHKVVDFGTQINSPFEIEVEIEQLPGEDRIDNNIAYETYWHFYKNVAVTDTAKATLSNQCLSAVPFMAMEVPQADGSKCENWDLAIEPSSGVIEPGETMSFSISGKPKAGAAAGDTCESEFGIFMPVTSVYTPVEAFGFDARVTDSSSLTCAAPGEASAAGTPVSVSGKLDPALADTIGLMYFDPTGKQEMKNLVTQSDGQYSDLFTPTLTGTWGVQAMWVGDNTHAPTTSPMCQFMVKEAEVKQPPLFKAEKAANCREGTSIFYHSVGITKAGSEYPVAGLLDMGGWYYIQFTDTQSCWVKGEVGQVSGDISGLPILQVNIITPTPTLIPTITPTPDFCSTFDFHYCVEKWSTRCMWIGTASAGKCVSK
ncbi:MAG: hypothetical protein AB9897_02455 [Anaerolineaceae bacterium]